MKYILVPSIFLFLWGLEVNADTYEIIEIPYKEIFPERYRSHGQNYRIQELQYQNQNNENHQNYLSYPNYQQTSVDMSLGNWKCRNPSTGQMQAMIDIFPMNNNQVQRKKRQSIQFFPNLIKKLYSTNVPLFQKSPTSVYHPKYFLNEPYEWECRNPMSGDMIIISSKNIPVEKNQDSKKKPYIPNWIENPALAPINCNYYPQHPMCGETIILGMTSPPAPEIKPNTNGIGLIDIR